MRSLFRYLLKNYGFFLFILLEVISLVFVFNNNRYQKAIYLSSANRFTASIYNSYNSAISYFRLSAVNRELAEENTRLKEQLQTVQVVPHILDSLMVSPVKESYIYNYVSARVINNSVNKPFNYITLNKGRKHGIKPDQGIVSASGIVGVITQVSESYSVGLSVLNQRWSVSARLKNTGFFGSLAWDGNDYRYARLNEIQFHVPITPGDTVVTSGFSTIFPEGVMIGVIDSFEQPGGEYYYQIKVKLSSNFKTLAYVEVIENVKKSEIEQLENLVQDNERAN